MKTVKSFAGHPIYQKIPKIDKRAAVIILDFDTRSQTKRNISCSPIALWATMWKTFQHGSWSYYTHFCREMPRDQ